MKKFSICILAILSTICFLFAAACSSGGGGYDIGPFEAKFKENAKSEYYLGKEICLDDQIERVEGAEMKVVVSWTALISGSVQTKELTGYGMYFFPEELGEHELEYVVSFGETVKTATKTISVVEEPENEEEIVVPDEPDTEENKLNGFADVYKKNAAVTVSEGEIKSITLAATTSDMLSAAAEDVSAYIGFGSGFEIGNTLKVSFTGKNLPMIGLFLDDAPEGTVIGGLTDAGTGIVFCNHNPLWDQGRLIGVGPYRMYSSDSTKPTNRNDQFTYFGTNGSSSAEMGYKNLQADKNYRLEIKLVSASEADNTATIDVAFYTVEGDESTLVTSFSLTTPAAWTAINYESTAFAFYSPIRPEFGKTTFSYEIDYDENAEKPVKGVANTYARKANTVVTEGVVTSVTLATVGNDMLSASAEDTSSYLGVKEGFNLGTTLAVNFTGKNLPMIGLFLDGAPEGSVIGGLTDAGTGIVFCNCNPLWDLGRYIGVGPYRMYSSDAEKKTNRNDAFTYFGTNGSSSAEMGYKNLVADTNYRLEIRLMAADETNNTATIAAKFYTVEGENKTLVAEFTLVAPATWTAINYESTAFAFYSPIRPEFGSVTFSYELIYDENAENPVKGVSGAYAKNANLIVTEGVVKSVTLSTVGNDMLNANAEDTASYLGFESGFAVGKTLAINFSGKNLPMLGLFLDDAPEGTVIGGLTNAGTGIVYCNCNPLWDMGRYIGVGPYRMFSSESGKATDRKDAITYFGPSGSSSAELGRKNLVDGTDYRLEISKTAADETANTATIVFKLYTVVGTEKEEVTTFTINFSGAALEAVNYASTAFAFYSPIRPEFGSVTFSFELYDTVA